MNAALEEGIKRVVVTSACITLSDDQTEKNKTFTESDWGDVNKVTSQYAGLHKSKILAERAAWDFYEKHKKDGFKLSTILPSLTIGPVLSSINKSSVSLFYPGFEKNVEHVHNIAAEISDVRDVALAHLRAAQLDEAVGHRFIVASVDRYVSSAEIFKIIKDSGYDVNKNIHDPANFDDFKNLRFDNSKMKDILKIEPTDLKKSALDMAKSFYEYGIVNK